AEMTVSLASGRVEVDIGNLEKRTNGTVDTSSKPGSGGVATLTAPVWAPPAPALELPAVFPEEIEVLVYCAEGGATLVGVIELVSPRNKDRPAARRAFAIKCLAYLQQGIGLVIVDVVTERLSNLHDEMVSLLPAESCTFPGSPPLYTVAYRPFRRGSEERIAVWPVGLSLGQPLPVVPLWLLGVESPVRLDLEGTYTETRQRVDLP